MWSAMSMSSLSLSSLLPPNTGNGSSLTHAGMLASMLAANAPRLATIQTVPRVVMALAISMACEGSGPVVVLMPSGAMPGWLASLSGVSGPRLLLPMLAQWRAARWPTAWSRLKAVPRLLSVPLLPRWGLRLALPGAATRMVLARGWKLSVGALGRTRGLLLSSSPAVLLPLSLGLVLPV